MVPGLACIGRTFPLGRGVVCARGEGSRVKIAGMVVWVLTAGIGIYLLAAGIAAQRQPAGGQALPRDDQPADDGSALAPGGGAAALTSGALGSGAAAGGPRGGSRAEGSPLLEFTHPMLALTGLVFWIFFVMTDDRLFAWIAFGVVVATVLAGVSWVLMTRRSARQRAAAHDAESQTAERRDRLPAASGPEPAAPGPRFPAHLVMVHGLPAACTFALVVIAAATAAHGCPA